MGHTPKKKTYFMVGHFGPTFQTQEKFGFTRSFGNTRPVSSCPISLFSSFVNRDRGREMGEEEDLQKKEKIKAGYKLAKRAGLKKKKNKKENNEDQNFKLVEIEKNSYKLKEERKKDKSLGKKRRSNEKRKNFEDEEANLFNRKADKTDAADGGKKKRKLFRNKKTKNEEIIEAENDEVGKLSNEMEDSFDEQNCSAEVGEKKRSKSRQKKRKNETTKEAEIKKVDKLYNEIEDGSNQRNDEGKMEALQSATQGQIERTDGQQDAAIGTKFSTRKSKKANIKKKDHVSSQNEELPEKREAKQDEVYEISSGDEDCSKGMKKWIMEYHQSRPGIKVLQERIDDFITAHEAQQEQARKEREARAAEGGWTVVVHHKGRKKTTDSESGIAVGSVAHAAVTDKMAKKKNKEVGLDFYRFQKREAQRNEIMMLQSKFEQDKKRIQQMRAARKFRPY